MGAPLRIRRRERQARRGAEGFLLFQAEERRRMRGDEARRLSVDESVAEVREIRIRWGRLSDEDKQAHHDRAALEHSNAQQKLTPEENQALREQIYSLKSPLLGMSSESKLISTTAFETLLRSELGLGPAVQIPGFSKYEEILRGKFVGDLFVRDCDDIPTDK
eukprot:7883734-Pyramimonas_sp.AAC.1